MCGITGVAWTSDGEPVADAVVWRMTDVLSHRGPDDMRDLPFVIGPAAVAQDPPAITGGGTVGWV